MSFQKTVLMVAVIALVVLLVFMAYVLTKAKYEAEWPPIVGNCPDYWVDLSGNGTACFNSKSLGKCNIPTKTDKNTMNFNIKPYNGADSECAKNKWATTCGVTWDGITYGVNNPCSTTTTNA